MKKCFIFAMSLILVPVFAFIIGCTTGGGGNGDGNGDTYDPNAIIISTNIETATEWISGKVYVVDGYIYINATLTIPGGTIIKFTANSGMSVNPGGTINAGGGTALLPIVFTSIKDDAHGGDTNMDSTASYPSKKDWYDITITANGSTFDYCDFFYGGGYQDYTLGIYDKVGTVTNCVFAHNDGTTYGALDLGSAAAGTTVTGNRFYDNVVPLQINTTFDVNDSNYFSDGSSVINTRNGIFVSGELVLGSRSWGETEVAYVIKTFLRIDMGNSLTLDDNVVLKFFAAESHLGLNGGSLNNYLGTGVYYTSYKDDDYKGDTNGDGSATTPDLAGDWDGVYNSGIADHESWSNILYALYYGGE